MQRLGNYLHKLTDIYARKPKYLRSAVSMGAYRRVLHTVIGTVLDVDKTKNNPEHMAHKARYKACYILNDCS